MSNKSNEVDAVADKSVEVNVTASPVLEVSIVPSKKEAVNAMTVSRALDEHVGQVFNLKGIIISPKVNGDGEVVPLTVLFVEGGLPLSTISPYVYECVHNVLSYYGEEEIKSGELEFTILKNKSKNGRDFLQIALV